MRRLLVAAVALSLGFGAFCFAEELLCRVIPLADIFWLASYDDESPRTETNYADIVQASDEYDDYYGMAWNSPEETDLTIGELDQYDLSGVTAIKLTLSATERITVRPYAGLGGEYCGKIGRFAVADPIIVGPDCQDYEFDVSGFGEEDPLRGCSGPLAEDALESLYSMVLLPDDRAGELRVYEVALCGEDIAQAAESSQDVSIPEFTIDPDVTRDSVVQIGDGPQELSTDIKFYPNTRRAEPGDTVYWTLEIGEESGLEPPVTIIPELDNDLHREPSLAVAGRRIVIEHYYDEPNPYKPYLTLRDSAGTTLTVFSRGVLAVLPEVETQMRIPLKLPTAEDPRGSVIKAGQVMTIDERHFQSASGLRYLTDRIDEWISAGINTVVVNLAHFVKAATANMILPIYENEPDPIFWTGTLPIENLLTLTGLLHARNLRVAWSFVAIPEGDYTALVRYGFDPTDISFYMRDQIPLKEYYAEIAEEAGVEMIGLATENMPFSLSPLSAEVVQSIRGVYTGIVFDTQFTHESLLLRYAITPYLDLICLSSGGANFEPSLSTEEMIGAFTHQYRTEMVSPLSELCKPAILEWCVAHTASDRGFQSRGTEAILSVLAQHPSLLMGSVVWELVLKQGADSQFNLFGKPSQQVLADYYSRVLPEERLYDLGSWDEDLPAVVDVIADFESRLISSWSVGALHGQASLQISSSFPYEGDQSLRIHFDSSNVDGQYANYCLSYNYSRPQDWRQYSTLNFYLRNTDNPGSVMVSVFDEDGDRFTAELFITYSVPNQWMPFTVELDGLFHPSWAEEEDGVLDLTRVVRFEVMEKIFHGRDQDSYIDMIYLGGPLDW